MCLWHLCSAQWSRCQLGWSCGQNFPWILGSCYRSIVSKIRVWKSQKNNISHGGLDPNTLRQIFLEIARQNWPFKIGLSLLDFKHILVDSGSIVQCSQTNWAISTICWVSPWKRNSPSKTKELKGTACPGVPKLDFQRTRHTQVRPLYSPQSHLIRHLLRGSPSFNQTHTLIAKINII